MLVANHDQIKAWLDEGLTAIKVGELLARRGVMVPKRTVQRYASEVCGAGRRRPTTVRVADGAPGSPSAIRTVGPWPLVRPHTSATADELIGQLFLTTTAIDAELDRGLHVAPHGLAFDLGQPLDGAEPLVSQPEPEYFSDLEHSDLPEHIAAFPFTLTGTRRWNRSGGPALVDPREVVP